MGSLQASPTEPRPWQPSSFIRASYWIHGAAAAGALLAPPWWPICAGAVVLNHAIITAAGLWPRSHLLGPNWTTLPAAAARRQEIAVTIDDGPDPEVTPKVLDILDCFGVKATFFCIGAKVREFSELCAEIRGRGHEVENHTQTHSHRFSLLGPSGYRREIEQAQDTIERVAGRRPVFFRAPAGLRNPFLEPVLCSLGLQLASWTRRGFDTLERDVDVVGRRLLSNLATGDILLLHDGHAARTAHGQAVVLEVLPRLLVLARDRGLKPVTLRQAMQ